jgi:hypothetical protein
VVWLGRMARQGRAHPMTQVLPRFAMGEPLPEDRVRAALRTQMDRIVRRLGADAVAGDAGWQARHDAALSVAQGGAGLPMSEVMDLAQGRESAQQSPPRQAIAAMVRLISLGPDLAGDDFLEALAAGASLSSAELEELQDGYRRAELAGRDPAAEFGALMSVVRLRQLAVQIELVQLQKSMSALYRLWALHGLLLIRALNTMAREHDPTLLPQLPKHLSRLPTQMAAIERDPMWHIFGRMPGHSPAARNLSLALMGCTIATQPSMLAELESYVERLSNLCEPEDDQDP